MLSDLLIPLFINHQNLIYFLNFPQNFTSKASLLFSFHCLLENKKFFLENLHEILASKFTIFYGSTFSLTLNSFKNE